MYTVKSKPSVSISVHKTIALDVRLSHSSKGIFLYLMAQNEQTGLSLNSISRANNCGTQSVKKAISELKQYGYLTFKNINATFYLNDNPNKNDMPKNHTREKTPKPPEKTNFDFDALLRLINKETGRSFRVVSDKVKRGYNARIKEGRTKPEIVDAIKNACKSEHHIKNKFRYLTPEFFSRSDVLDKYGVKTKESSKKESYGIPIG